MSDKVILIGAGGHAKVIADIVLKSGDQLLGFLDDDPEKTCVMGYPILGRISEWERFAGESKFLLAIGNNHLRKSLATELQVDWYTAIHPSAQIGMDVIIGEGSAVMANAVINPGARVGRHCIINTSSVVEHDNVIGNYTHVSVGVRLGGSVSIGDSVWIGIGATVKNNVFICGKCTIGAGSVVVKNIEKCGIYVGIPANELKNNTKLKSSGGGVTLNLNQYKDGVLVNRHKRLLKYNCSGCTPFTFLGARRAA